MPPEYDYTVTKGSADLPHYNGHDLKRSATEGCHLCSIFWEQLGPRYRRDQIQQSFSVRLSLPDPPDIRLELRIKRSSTGEAGKSYGVLFDLLRVDGKLRAYPDITLLRLRNRTFDCHERRSHYCHGVH